MGSPIPWMAAAEGATQLNNQAIIGFQQRRNIERQNTFNKEMAEYSYSKDLEMWNRQNAYNSPQAQMERLKAAGLNPNMVYGQGTVAGNTSGQMPRYQAPTASFNVEPMVKFPSVIGMFQDMAIKQGQIQGIQKDNEFKEFQNVIKSIEAKVAEKYLEPTAREKYSLLDYSARKRMTEAEIGRYSADMKSLEAKNYPRLLEATTQGQELKNEGYYRDNIFKQFENSFRSVGITSSDNVFVRMITRMLLGSRMGEWWRSISWK